MKKEKEAREVLFLASLIVCLVYIKIVKTNSIYKKSKRQKEVHKDGSESVG